MANAPGVMSQRGYRGRRVFLSRYHRERLKATPDEWTDMEHNWRAGIVFLRLEDRGLVEMRFRRTDYSDISCGPGSHVSGRWQTRRTDKGREALQLTRKDLTDEVRSPDGHRPEPLPDGKANPVG